MSFKHVENMLRNNVDREPVGAAYSVDPIKPVSNVRGSDYFARDLIGNADRAECDNILSGSPQINGEMA